MKKCLLFLIATSCVLSANDEVPVLLMQSPAVHIDREAVAAEAQQWASTYVAQLSGSELKVLTRTLHLGKVFSEIDLKMRVVVQAMLVSMCTLFQEISAGDSGSRISQQIETQVREFSSMKGLHALVSQEWQEWTNVLGVAENERVIEAIEKVNDSIRQEIEKVLSLREWQVLANRVPQSAQKTIKTLTLFSTLCQTTARKEEVDEQAAESIVQDPVVVFDMIARAAEMSCERSFETIEAASQLMMYEAMFLEISYVMFESYLEQLQQASQEHRAALAC